MEQSIMRFPSRKKDESTELRGVEINLLTQEVVMDWDKYDDEPEQRSTGVWRVTPQGVEIELTKKGHNDSTSEPFMMNKEASDQVITLINNIILGE